MPQTEKGKSLVVIKAEIRACTACPLYETLVLKADLNGPT